MSAEAAILAVVAIPAAIWLYGLFRAMTPEERATLRSIGPSALRIALMAALTFACIRGASWFEWALRRTPPPSAVHWVAWIRADKCGAKGDGVTDDTAALNRCMEWPAIGGTVLLQKGAYAVGSTILAKGEDIGLNGKTYEGAPGYHYAPPSFEITVPTCADQPDPGEGAWACIKGKWEPTWIPKERQ